MQGKPSIRMSSGAILSARRPALHIASTGSSAAGKPATAFGVGRAVVELVVVAG